MSEVAINKAFASMENWIARMELMSKPEGTLARLIERDGGDPSGLVEFKEILGQLDAALEEAKFYALSHTTAESDEFEDTPENESTDGDLDRLQHLAGIRKD